MSSTTKKILRYAGVGLVALIVILIVSTIVIVRTDWFRNYVRQKIITATKAGTAPEPAVVALAGARSRHNTYMSVPLLWAMINSHTATLPAIFGIPGDYAWLLLLLVILLGWHIVWHLYRRAPKVKGF